MARERLRSRMVPLSAAAAITYRCLARQDAVDGLLDVAAIALATCIPVYTGAGRLSEEQLARGDFINGATRLRFRDGRPAIEGLAVRAADLDYAIERLQRAGVSFAHALFDGAPRRLPRVVPA